MAGGGGNAISKCNSNSTREIAINCNYSMYNRIRNSNTGMHGFGVIGVGDDGDGGVGVGGNAGGGGCVITADFEKKMF